jgi:ATP-dependent DNA ligase
MLARHSDVRVTYPIFDALSLDGGDLMGAPHSERRAQLEALNLNDKCWRTTEAFDDGESLFDVVCKLALESASQRSAGGRASSSDFATA